MRFLFTLATVLLFGALLALPAHAYGGSTNIDGCIYQPFGYTDCPGMSLEYANFASDRLINADFAGSDLTGATFERAYALGINSAGANLTDANLGDLAGGDTINVAGATFAHTTCPDWTNSDHDGGTCAGHLQQG